MNLHGQSLEVTWDELTLAPQYITAVGSALLEIKNINGLTRNEINDIGALLVRKYGDLLKISPQHLVLKKAEKTDGIWRVSYQQIFRGMAVHDSSLWFSIDPEGHIKSLGAMLYPNARPPVSVRFSRGQALRTAYGSLSEEEKKGYRLHSEASAIYPERKTGSIDYRQVYIFTMLPRKSEKSPARRGWAVFVDAQTGTIVRTQAISRPQELTPPKEEIPESAFH